MHLKIVHIFDYYKIANLKMISSVVFINIKGEILIYRTFKDDITRA